MIAISRYSGQRIAVLGLGRTGFATARALQAGGAIAVCWDDNASAAEVARAEGLEVLDLNIADNWAGISQLILSPGIPHLYPEPNPCVQIALALGIGIDNDCGLFLAQLIIDGMAEMEAGDFDPVAMPHVICVTGSNGKSTVTALIHHILVQAGRVSQMGGNIGRAVLDLDPLRPHEIVVLELSSYQCEVANCLSHDVSIFLNLSPDHLGRHGGVGGYYAAKRRMLEMGAPRVAIVGADEFEGQQLAAGLSGIYPGDGPFPDGLVRVVSEADFVGGAGQSVVHGNGMLAAYDGGAQEDGVDLGEANNLRGDHNGQNAAAAYAACRAVGLSTAEIEAGFNSFGGLPHRMEILGRRGSVCFVNDSKATNAEAVAKALGTFEDIFWIAGGQAKEGGIAGLEPFFGRIKKAYLIGAAMDDFAATLDGHVAFEKCETLEIATKQAMVDVAETGGTVLLSPACASWDQFDSFEHRGDAFRALVGEFK